MKSANSNMLLLLVICIVNVQNFAQCEDELSLSNSQCQFDEAAYKNVSTSILSKWEWLFDIAQYQLNIFEIYTAKSVGRCSINEFYEIVGKLYSYLIINTAKRMQLNGIYELKHEFSCTEINSIQEISTSFNEKACFEPKDFGIQLTANERENIKKAKEMCEQRKTSYMIYESLKTTYRKLDFRYMLYFFNKLRTECPNKLHDIQKNSISCSPSNYLKHIYQFPYRENSNISSQYPQNAISIIAQLKCANYTFELEAFNNWMVMCEIKDNYWLEFYDCNSV